MNPAGPGPKACWAVVLLSAGALGAAACAPQDDGLLDTVVLITLDATNANMLEGNFDQWRTAPELWAFFDEGALFPNAIAPRSQTAVALTSLSTGTYPRDHNIRSNDDEFKPAHTTLPERFQDAGYRTLGYSANICWVFDYGFDERYCTWGVETPDLGEDLAFRDEILLRQATVRLGGLAPEERILLWIHLNQPHKPFQLVDEWYQEFHPEPYEGGFDPGNVSATYDVALGEAPFTEEDLLHTQAVYASQLRAADERIAVLLDSLRAIGRYDDALIFFGIDHGEELAEHNNYLYHGCSWFNSVLRVPFAFRAPNLPAGQVFEGWTSTVDVAPTIVELAGFKWAGTMPGRSLAKTMLSGEEESVPVYFERGTEDAGVILGDDKYMLSPDGGNDFCEPYSGAGTAYPGDPEELYDLANDPGELVNLAKEEEDLRQQLRDEVCDWVLARDWVAHDQTANNELITSCQADR